MQNIYSLMKYLLHPEVWIFVGLSATCLLAWVTRCPRAIRLMLTLLLVLYYGLTTHPLAQALVQPLETYYRPPATPAHYDAIVLFVNDSPTLPPFGEPPTIVGTRNADLLLCGLTHVQAHSAPRVVLVGAERGDWTAVLRQWAVLVGYPPEAISTVDQAGTATHERARGMKQLLGSDEKILLIDSAMHLPRSALTFQKAGFAVTPVPCDARNMSTGPWSPSAFVPHAENLVASSEAIYEYVGLLTYWLRGLIK